MYPIDFFWRSVARFPDAPAVIGPKGTISFGELKSIVLQQAAAITALDPDVGSRVAIGAANTVEHLVALLSTFAAGKVWIPLNPRNGDPELKRIIDFAKPKLVLCDDELQQRLAIQGVATVPLAALLAGQGDPSSVAMGPNSLAGCPMESPQAIKFTGGTTGTPKGVIQSLRTWNTNIFTQIHELGLTRNDRYLVAAPITHGTGTYVLPVLGAGGALIFPDYAKPDQMLDAIAAHKATLFFAPATLLMVLAEEQRTKPRDVSTLRYVIYGGAPMRPEQIRVAKSIFGPIICTSYGQTEAPQVITFMSPEEMTETNIASVGRPTIATRIAILDDAGRPVGVGETGEIAVHGDLVMEGYLDAPEESAKTLVNGWLRTGDSGIVDERGYLFLRDRLRDVIITGGFNVYPSDVEIVLDSHPDIADCVVLGVSDPKWGEAVHAAVQLKPGRQVSAESLMDFVRVELGPVKTPKQIHFFDALPRSAVSKVMKDQLRVAIAKRESAA